MCWSNDACYFIPLWPIVTTRKRLGSRESGTSFIIVGETVVGKMGVGEMATPPSLMILHWLSDTGASPYQYCPWKSSTTCLFHLLFKEIAYLHCGWDRFNDISSREIWLL